MQSCAWRVEDKELYEWEREEDRSLSSRQRSKKRNSEASEKQMSGKTRQQRKRPQSVFVFPAGEARSGGAQEQGVERRSDSVRSPNRFYVPPPKPPPPPHPDPEEHPSPHLIPHVPHPPAILPHTTMKLPQPETPPRDSGRFKWGWGWEKKLKELQKKRKERLMSPTHSSQKRMFLLRFK